MRALLLRERLELATTDPGARYSRFTETLARTVLDANGEPIFSADEWEIFGAPPAGQAVAFKLFNIVQRLSGLGSEQPDPNPSAPS